MGAMEFHYEWWISVQYSYESCIQYSWHKMAHYSWWISALNSYQRCFRYAWCIMNTNLDYKLQEAWICNYNHITAEAIQSLNLQKKTAGFKWHQGFSFHRNYLLQYCLLLGRWSHSVHCGLILVNTGSGNGLLSDSTKSLLEPILVILNGFLWHLPDSNLTGSISDINS